jgi:hypothetical protein
MNLFWDSKNVVGKERRVSLSSDIPRSLKREPERKVEGPKRRYRSMQYFSDIVTIPDLKMLPDLPERHNFQIISVQRFEGLFVFRSSGILTPTSYFT